MAVGKVDNKYHLKVKEAKLFSAVGTGCQVFISMVSKPPSYPDGRLSSQQLRR